MKCKNSKSMNRDKNMHIVIIGIVITKNGRNIRHHLSTNKIWKFFLEQFRSNLSYEFS